MNTRRSRVGAALAIAMLLAGAGVVGCGSGGSGGAGDSEGASAVIAKVDAVDVTYYFLPG